MKYLAPLFALLTTIAGTANGQGAVTFGPPAWPTTTTRSYVIPRQGTIPPPPGYQVVPQPIPNYQPPVAPSPYPYAYPYLNPSPYVPGYPGPPAGGAVPATQVSGWYSRYLRRQVDQSGLQSHVDAYRRSGPELALSGILGSPEYFRLWGNNNRRFIEGLYSDVLHRGARRDEIETWARQLNRRNRNQVTLEFLRQARNELGGPYY